jgi:hypothetical protein
MVKIICYLWFASVYKQMEVWMTTLLLIAVLLEALVCNLSTVPGVSAQTQDYYPWTFFKTKYRLNFGGNGIIRFPDDAYDRYWFPVQGSNSTFLSSTNSGLQILMSNKSFVPVSEVDYPPDAVMGTALTDKSGNMTIYFPDTNSYEMYMLFYYAELDPTANVTSRTYYVEVADTNTVLVNPILNQSSHYPNVLVYYGISYYDGWNILLYPDPTSPLGSLVNALEFFEIEGQMVKLTNPQDGALIIWL